nr:alkene reductase [Rhodococcus qingshengii]
MHTGRIGHPSLLPKGAKLVAPSAIAAQGSVFTHQGMRDFVAPKEMTRADIEQAISEFADAARNAIAAGFDGVEIHGANGYLVHQFLAPNANHRTDEWGGSPSKQSRFAYEVAAAVVGAIGAERTGIRLSPGVLNNGIDDGPEAAATYLPLITALQELDLAYLHILEAGDRNLTHTIRERWSNTLMLNPTTPGRPTGPDELELIDEGLADLISFGALFLANPDLPERLAKGGGPLNEPDRSTFYGGGAEGYTDYPTLVRAEKQQ